jgi:hypothetical protein
MIDIGQPTPAQAAQNSILHPVVQMKLGTEDFILTVPPNNLVEFTYTSLQAIDTFSIA